MGRFADEGKCTGFIRDIFRNLQNSCTAEDLKKFAALSDDEDRYRFVSQIKYVKEFAVTRNSTSMKNLKLALNFKQKGNEAFQQKRWMSAIDFYNKSLLIMPSENVEDFSILLANRSAALYHLEKYDDALQDIELAEDQYPKEMLHKLKERSARCHLAKKSYALALNAFKETITHLDNSKLQMDKRGKLEKDAQIMIKMLPRQIEMEKKMQGSRGKQANASKASSIVRLSNAVTFDFNEQEGRFAKTTRNIKVGEEILVEPAHCATLLETFSKSHCQNCLKRSVTPLPCPNCIDVVFCSKKCRDEAASSYHCNECGILETIWNSGSSINCLMALRVISQKPLSYFKDMQPELTEKLDFDDVKHLPPSDYRRVYTMIRHEKEREMHSFFQYAFMATFLVNFLQANNYFGGIDVSDEMVATDQAFIGGLIMRNLQVLQFNSHEIFDLLKSKKSGSTQTVAIGAGLFATLALFNHSCNPSIVRYFKNTSVHVTAIRNMKQGELVSENYGPLYSQNPKAERKRKLKDFYWFDCQCEACEENWPVFDDMNTNEIRFKCGGKKSCNNVIAIPVDCNDFMIQCIQCGEYTNILKGLKAVQDTEILEKSAKRLLNEGNIEAALKKYIEMMNIFDDVIAPPFQDYCRCQQAIKDCLLENGNRILLD